MASSAFARATQTPGMHSKHCQLAQTFYDFDFIRRGGDECWSWNSLKTNRAEKTDSHLFLKRAQFESLFWLNSAKWSHRACGIACESSQLARRFTNCLRLPRWCPIAFPDYACDFRWRRWWLPCVDSRFRRSFACLFGEPICRFVPFTEYSIAHSRLKHKQANEPSHRRLHWICFLHSFKRRIPNDVSVFVCDMRALALNFRSCRNPNRSWTIVEGDWCIALGLTAIGRVERGVRRSST